MKRTQVLSLWILVWVLSACSQRVIADTAPVTPTALVEITTAAPMPTLTPERLLPTSTTVPLRSVCDETTGRVQSEEIAPQQGAPRGKDRPMAVRVYVPPCYDPLKARYPVLIMLHGQSYREDQWERIGIVRAANQLIAAGEVPAFLIVMPQEEDTLREVSESLYDERIVEEVVPWVDAHYASCAERACRAIGGLSRGGAWAVRVGFSHWELFGAIGAHSTPPHFNDPNRLPGWIKDIPADELPRVYMDVGRYDPYLRYAREFETLLTQFNIPHEWYLFDGRHDEAYWSTHVEAYLRWYARGWGKENVVIIEP